MCQHGLYISILLIVLFVATPGSALALQTHGPPEGLYIHQIAHVFFAIAMITLLIFLLIRPIGEGRGWHYFRISLVFFFLWNVNAFIAHTVESQLPEEAILGSGHLFSQYLPPPFTAKKVLYYIAKFDHLLCVPAMVFLVLALKTFCREAERKREDASRDAVA